MASLLRGTIILVFFFSALAGLAQPVPPVVADTGWDVLPTVINIRSMHATMDRNGNFLCGVLIGDTSKFGSTIIERRKYEDDIGVAKYGPDGTPLWIRPTGHRRWENIQAFDADMEGNSFAVYYTRLFAPMDTLTIGSTRIPTYGGAYLVKYSPSGDLLWVTSLGDSINTFNVEADGNGGVIVAGMLNGSYVYGRDTITIPGRSWEQNRHAAVVISVAADGSFRWARSVVRKNGASAYNVGMAPNGDIMVAGLLLEINLPDTTIIGTSRITSTGPYVARYRANGDVLWARGIMSGSLELYLEDFAFDSTGNIIIAGIVDNIGERNFGKVFWDTLGATGRPIPSYGSHDVFLAKMSSEGQLLWEQVMGGRKWDVVRNVHVVPDGGILLTGTLGGHVEFGGHDYYAQGNDATFVARYDAGGNPGWLKIYDPRGQYSAAEAGRSTWAASSQLDMQGRLWIIGGFTGVMTFDGLTLGTAIPSHLSYANEYVANTFAVRLAPGSHTPPEPVWTKIDNGLPYNMYSFGAPDVRALTIFDGQLYAGLAPGDAHYWLRNTGSGVYSSGNQGTNWTRHTGGNNPGDSLRYGVECFATLGDSLYHITGLLTHSSAYYLKAMVLNRAIPNRWNWLKRSGNPDLIRIFDVDGTLYGASRDYGLMHSYGLLRWSRDSMTWNLMDTAVLGKMLVRKLTGYGDVLVASTFNEDGVLRSDDRGRTWKPAVDGLPRTATGELHGANDLAIVGTTIYLAAPEGYAPPYATGVYRSNDGGENWTMINEGLPYRRYNPDDSIAIAMDVFYVKNGVLFAGCEQGIWMLTPGAQRWVSITDDIQQCRVNAMIADDTYFYASMNYCGMWRRPLSTLVMGVNEDRADPIRKAPTFNLTVTPNPVMTEARICFTLPNAGNVTVSLHDVAGGLVRVIATGAMAEGNHELRLNMPGFYSGAYFVRVKNKEGSESAEVIYHR